MNPGARRSSGPTAILLSALILFLSLALFGRSSLAETPSSFAERITEANALRSTDPARFASLLVELNDARAQMPADLHDDLDYLNAYQRAFEGDYAAGIALARPLLSASDDGLRFRAGLLIVNSLAATRDFQSGLRQLDDSLGLLDAITDPELRANGLVVAALFYNQVGQYPLGQHYAERALAEPATSQRVRCIAQHNTIEAHFRLATLPDDDAAIHQAIADCVAEGELVVANFIRLTLARKWASSDATAQATELLHRHLDEIDASHYPRLIAEVHSLLAEYELTLDRPEEAREHALTAVDRSAGLPYSLPLANAQRVLYELAQADGDSARALAHYRAFAEADKAYLNDVNARELAFQTVRHETLQKNQTIDLLNKQNELLQLEQQAAQESWRNIKIIAVLVVALLVTLATWLAKMRSMQATLKRLAETDALTGADSRLHFTRSSERLLRQASDSGRSAAMILFDLDRFKSINDRFGHPVGDWVLKRAVSACAPAIEAGGRVGRLGGEEFAVILCGVDRDAAKAMAETLRTRIAAIDSGETGHTFKISASFGVAVMTPPGRGFSALVAQADEALYRAKRDGRNQVFVYRPGCGLETSARKAD